MGHLTQTNSEWISDMTTTGQLSCENKPAHPTTRIISDNNDNTKFAKNKSFCYLWFAKLKLIIIFASYNQYRHIDIYGILLSHPHLSGRAYYRAGPTCPHGRDQLARSAHRHQGHTGRRKDHISATICQRTLWKHRPQMSLCQYE